jgi:hypothetical protein
MNLFSAEIMGHRGHGGEKGVHRAKVSDPTGLVIVFTRRVTTGATTFFTSSLCDLMVFLSGLCAQLRFPG